MKLCPLIVLNLIYFIVLISDVSSEGIDVTCLRQQPSHAVVPEVRLQTGTVHRWFLWQILSGRVNRMQTCIFSSTCPAKRRSRDELQLINTVKVIIGWPRFWLELVCDSSNLDIVCTVYVSVSLAVGNICEVFVVWRWLASLVAFVNCCRRFCNVLFIMQIFGAQTRTILLELISGFHPYTSSLGENQTGKSDSKLWRVLVSLYRESEALWLLSYTIP